MEKRFHGKVGKEYELFKLAFPYYDFMQSQVPKILGPKIQKAVKFRVLELGFGSGATTFAALSAAKSVHILAVDNEPVMIAKARKNLAKEVGKGRVKLVLADALSFLKKRENGSFDAVVSAFMLHNLDKNYRSKVFREIFRVLKAKGIFVNVDKYAQDSKSEFEKEYDRQTRIFESAFRKIDRPDLAKEWIRHHATDRKPNLIQKEGAFRQEMEKIGFSKTTKKLRKRMDAVYVAQK